MDQSLFPIDYEKGGYEYCICCGHRTHYTIFGRSDLALIRGMKIFYVEKAALCDECEKEIYVARVADSNIDEIGKTYKAKLEERTNDLA